MMRPEGVEPPRVSPRDPKSRASAGSATVACAENVTQFVGTVPPSRRFYVAVVRRPAHPRRRFPAGRAGHGEPVPGAAALRQRPVGILHDGDRRRAHAMVMKSGDRPAQRMPDQMVAMMSGRMGQNMASEMAKQCERSEVVGTESVTVPAGTFRALHIRSDKTESWMSRQIPFYMVRVQLENGGTMELTGHGRDAKSLITE